MSAPSILWFRRDLRVTDHPALLAAIDAGARGEVLPLVVIDPAEWESTGAPRRRRWRASLRVLDELLDGALVIRRGDPRRVVPELAAELGSEQVLISADATPEGQRRDSGVHAALDRQGRRLRAVGGPYAVGPGTVRNASGDPYRVFTPFAKAWREHGWPDPAPEPASARWSRQLDGQALDEACPMADGAGGRQPDPVTDGRPDPVAAPEEVAPRWEDFLDSVIAGYDETRDRPDRDGTSRLSTALALGEVHPRTLLADIAEHPDGGSPGGRSFVTELAWREFYADVLHHHPHSAWEDLTGSLGGIGYDDDAEAFAAWCQGRTGYPFVDAGMRQLTATGWMHNRLRMVTASFLVKDLHQWWPAGARHFLDHLVDADLASNNHGWQWVAGTGTDAAPYFRVFNPVTQGRRFDPDGTYVRRWIPELRHLEGVSVHEPWKAADGYAHGYPERIVDHAEERRVALDRYGRARD